MPPLMYFQQHLNHAYVKLAQMSSSNLTLDDLEGNLKRRWTILGLETEALRLRKHATSAGGIDKRQAKDDPASDVTEGFSRIEFEALIGNAETDGPETFENTLGLDIMSNDIGYYTDIQIGTPPRDFKILIDSGSADSWVTSQVCPSCGNHTQLGSRTSTTFDVSNRPFQITYGLGNVEGFVAQDNMKIGNLSLDGILFGVTTFESPEFGADRVLFDGLMGTAQSILSNQRVLSPIESLGRAGKVASSAMGYALGRVADGVNEGTVTFGGINLAQIDGGLVEVPNVSQVGFWEGAIDVTTVNGQSLGLQGRTAILDTGTTLVIVPSADALAIHAAIPGSRPDGQGGFVIPCDTDAVVAFMFSGQSFAIDPRDLPFIPLNGNDPTGECQSGISAGTAGRSTQWLLGDVFLKSVYFATEVESNTIGLGKRK